MDESTFDALTRSVVTQDGTRRGMMRLLAGTVLGAIASRLGPAEGAAAKAKPHRRTANRTHHEPGHSSHKHRAQAHSHQKEEKNVQNEGKRKGKGKKGKHHHNPPQSPPPLSPLPPGCQNCNACQMCQDGTCVPDPALGGVPCQGSGTGCNHCLLGECVATEQLPCDDGLCAHRGQCCPGEQYCRDPESSLGYSCLGPTDCCPGQKKCGDQCISASGCCDEDRPQCAACDTATCDHGSWICPGTCCPTEKQCPDGTCVGKTACCPGEHQCADGSCIRNFACCPDEHKCSDGTCSPADLCCLDEKRCADGSCQECCPEEAPSCGECEAATCVAGEYVCSPSGACGPQCGEGYCPKGMYCDHPGTCCGTPQGGTEWTCVCASGYTGGGGCNANGQCCRQGCCYPYCCEDPRAGGRTARA